MPVRTRLSSWRWSEVVAWSRGARLTRRRAARLCAAARDAVDRERQRSIFPPVGLSPHPCRPAGTGSSLWVDRKLTGSTTVRPAHPHLSPQAGTLPWLVLVVSFPIRSFVTFVRTACAPCRALELTRDRAHAGVLVLTSKACPPARPCGPLPFLPAPVARLCRLS